MSHVYTVSADERTLMHVEADSKSEARRVALSGVKVERLDASEVLDLTRRGIAIVSAKTGKVCNAPDEGASANMPADKAPPLVISDHSA